MAVGVQFTSKEKVIEAYERNAIHTWAIFSGKELFMKGSNGDQLEGALTLLEENATNVAYTLRVYEDIEPKQVKSNTASDGGFNFYLNAESMQLTVGQHQRLYGSGTGSNSELISVVNGLKKQIEDLQADKEAPSKLGIVGEILDHPVLGSILEKIALKYVDTIIPGDGRNAGAAIPMRAVGNISTDAELVQALERLKEIDPQLTQHLIKLAIIAENDKATWNIIISALDKM